MRGVFEKRAKCVQGGGGSQKMPKKCVRTKYTLPNNAIQNFFLNYKLSQELPAVSSDQLGSVTVMFTDGL